MATTLKSRVLVAGVAEGIVLRLAAPVSFWGGVSPQTATIVQAGHPDEGTCISGQVLLLPGTIGSSSSSAVLLELLYREIAPCAIILCDVDAILALGDLVAGEMGYPTIPMILLPEDRLKTGQMVRIERAGTVTIISDTRRSPNGIMPAGA